MVKVKKDTNQIIIETTIRRTLRDISISPERSIRNLVDLALNFSNGRFQRRFLETAQTMLKNKKSAYYQLLKNVIKNIDHNTISTFGVNLGYNSCTKGAKRIRSIEAREGFNIPWSLNLIIDRASWEKNQKRYFTLVDEGKALGIYTYLIYIEGEVPGFSDFLAQNSDCAFVLFVKAEDVNESCIEDLARFHNLMISIDSRTDYEPLCQKLLERKVLYALHTFYTVKNRETILSGRWINSMMPMEPVFLFLIPRLQLPGETPAELRKEMYDYTLTIRNEQNYATFLMDLPGDTLVIDRIISDDGCAALFDKDGTLYTSTGQLVPQNKNLFEKPLKEIFRDVLVKA